MAQDFREFQFNVVDCHGEDGQVNVEQLLEFLIVKFDRLYRIKNLPCRGNFKSLRMEMVCVILDVCCIRCFPKFILQVMFMEGQRF